MSLLFVFRSNGFVNTSEQIYLFWRICNPPVLIIRICTPINCFLFVDSKACLSGLQILIVYFGGLQITPKRRYRRNKETV